MKKVKILGIMVTLIMVSTGLAFSVEKAPQKMNTTSELVVS